MTDAQLGNKFESVQSVEITPFVIQRTCVLEVLKLFHQARHFTKLIPNRCFYKLNNRRRTTFKSFFKSDFGNNNFTKYIYGMVINLCRCRTLYCVLFGRKLPATKLCAWSLPAKQFCRNKGSLCYKNVTNYKQRLSSALLYIIFLNERNKLFAP